MFPRNPSRFSRSVIITCPITTFKVPKKASSSSRPVSKRKCPNGHDVHKKFSLCTGYSLWKNHPALSSKRGFSGQQRGGGWGGGALASLTFGKDDICILSMRYVGRINFKIFWGRMVQIHAYKLAPPGARTQAPPLPPPSFKLKIGSIVPGQNFKENFLQSNLKWFS